MAIGKINCFIFSFPSSFLRLGIKPISFWEQAETVLLLVYKDFHLIFKNFGFFFE